MARHDSPKKPAAQRALAVLATAGVALGAGATTADAASAAGVPDARSVSLGKIDPRTGLQAMRGAVGHVTGPVSGMKPNPLADTGADPLDNGVGTQVADFKPVNSQALTRPVAQAESIGSMPVVGQAAGPLSR